MQVNQFYQNDWLQIMVCGLVGIALGLAVFGPAPGLDNVAAGSSWMEWGCTLGGLVMYISAAVCE